MKSVCGLFRGGGAGKEGLCIDRVVRKKKNVEMVKEMGEGVLKEGRTV